AEAQVGGEELLIEDGCTQERRHLLFFDNRSWKNQRVAVACKDCARNAALEWSKEGDHAIFKGKFRVAAAQLDTVCGVDGVNGGGIETQGVQRVVELARRQVRAESRGGRKNTGEHAN